MGKSSAKFDELVEIIGKLRQPDGCPWDRKQTVESFRPYLLEEMHELFEALDHDDHRHIKEELGDMLFQIIFLGKLYEERDIFTIAEVLETISAKMIRRHPHVFGDKKFNSEKELRRNWNKIKKCEKEESGQRHKDIFSFPRSLPALFRAQRVSGRAVSSGFEWPDMDGVLAKLDEEIEELKEALASGNRPGIEDEIGDLLFTMVNVSRKAGFEAETILQRSTEKFTRRFTRMSELAAQKNGSLEELDILAMQELWIQVKKEE
ncbi:MAG: nucleoside triphosphate pyrophosphohydrolase [Desulfurivibrionaceae bacterium]|nr:nucleoside triphosphate pyrophosphohydrolase [Desulfurivibrionaceae bacterium]